MPLPIKILIPVAYDYNLSLNTIKHVYDYADIIQIALDRDRLTWTGDEYEISPEYWKALNALDKHSKIQIYEDKFFVEGKEPIVLDTLQRIAMSEQVGKEGWHIQLDADEYFLDFGRFVSFLRKCERHYKDLPLDIYVNFISMFKRDESGYFLAWPPLEIYPVATNKPNYRRVRSSHQEGRLCLKADSYILHDTWSRNENALTKKLSSWGHLNDFDVDSYIKFSRSVDARNYMYIRDFHPINTGLWSRILYLHGSLSEIIKSAPIELLATRSAKLGFLKQGEEKYFMLPATIQLLVSMFKQFTRKLNLFFGKH